MVQRKCKPNAIKLAWIAEVQPFLSKDTRNKIVEVKVEGLPASAQEEPKQESPSQEPSSTVTKPSGVRILVELRMTNGLHISQKNLSYQELKRLIEKLEGLCWVLSVLTASIISVTLRICDASIAGCYPLYVNNSTVNPLAGCVYCNNFNIS